MAQTEVSCPSEVARSTLPPPLPEKPPNWTIPGVGKTPQHLSCPGLNFLEGSRENNRICYLRLLAGAGYRLKKLLGTLANLTMPAVDFGHSDFYRAVKKKRRAGEGGSPGAFPCWFIFTDRKVLRPPLSLLPSFENLRDTKLSGCSSGGPGSLRMKTDLSPPRF